MNKILNLLLIILLLCTAQACAINPSSSDSVKIAVTEFKETQKTPYWWYASYGINWLPDREPDFYIDLLLADAVIKPTLLKYRQDIKYWRFHRRAAHDQAGHRFSFIFYADKETAIKIYSELQSSPLLTKLQQRNLVININTDDPDNNPRTDITAASDKNWPVEIQESWPAYIMGVSSMWLQLIDQQVDDNNQQTDIDKLLDQYRQANNNITRLWRSEAQHAFLHHLNAIFGYEEILIQKAVRF